MRQRLERRFYICSRKTCQTKTTNSESSGTSRVEAEAEIGRRVRRATNLPGRSKPSGTEGSEKRYVTPLDLEALQIDLTIRGLLK